jgi:NADH-quinone oxidoreductase subunit F
MRNRIRLRTICSYWCAYICGEETALIESLEGKEEILVSSHHFLQFQVYGPTTVVNNVETIASVPWIVNNSGDDYAKMELEDLLELN